MLPILLLVLQAVLWRDGSAATVPQGSVGIVPKNKAKGVDFCGVGRYYYIIRSDIGLYMRSTNFNEGNDIEIFDLHNSVRGGDHYLADKDDHFYVIKGNSYRRVDNLNKDTAAVVESLHSLCRRGDHYFSSGKYFYILYKAKGECRRVTNMKLDSDARSCPVPAALKDCLYYWGTEIYAFCVKPHDKWGAEYRRTTNFEKNSEPVTYSFHPSVVNFLPGGVAVTYGKSFSLWQRISVIVNEASVNITREYTVTRKIGYEKEKMKSIEHNWNIAATVSVGPGGLAQSFVQSQFSLETSYGGSNVDTSTEKWSEATEIEDKFSFTLSPKKKIYVWQYKLGIGKEDVLYSRSALAFTDTATPPALNPYEPSKK